ncbi:MAG: hypothetical protein K1X75_07500 [Leptospirales bacterium]|nr:hypothetical protein [Leptospirales bacterium]
MRATDWRLSRRVLQPGGTRRALLAAQSTGGAVQLWQLNGDSGLQRPVYCAQIVGGASIE